MSDRVNVICIDESLAMDMTFGKIYEAIYISRKTGLIQLDDDAGYPMRFHIDPDKLGQLVVIPHKVHRNLKLEELLDEEG